MATQKAKPVLHAGKLPYVHDERTFHLKDYLAQEPKIDVPKEHNWGKIIKREDWKDFGNLKINNCTCAAAGHLMMTWNANIGRLSKPTTKSIVAAYTDITGYNPKTDGFGKPVEAIKTLKYWRKHGISGRTILAFAKLSFKNREQLKQAIYLYGGCYVGLNLPKSAEEQFNDKKTWSVPESGAKGKGEPGSLFGHAILITGYNKKELMAVTWGREIRMTFGFWETYVDESYAIFSEDFIKHNQTPTKISVDVLRQDIEALQATKQD